LFEQIGSSPRILLTDQSELARVSGDRGLAAQIAAIKELALQLIKSDEAKPMLADAHSIVRYLCADMGHLRVETLRAIFLDNHNRLLRDETMWSGTAGEVAIHTREVLRRALEVDASAIILAHNHPSGVLRPSASDIEFTHDMLHASATLGLIFHDHLIITASGAVSLRFEKMVEPWH
jgi:DNA repair protein RadC